MAEHRYLIIWRGKGVAVLLFLILFFIFILGYIACRPCRACLRKSRNAEARRAATATTNGHADEAVLTPRRTIVDVEVVVTLPRPSAPRPSPPQPTVESVRPMSTDESRPQHGDDATNPTTRSQRGAGGEEWTDIPLTPVESTGSHAHEGEQSHSQSNHGSTGSRSRSSSSTSRLSSTTTLI